MVCAFCKTEVGAHEFVVYGNRVAHPECANDYLRTYVESDEERWDRLESQEG